MKKKSYISNYTDPLTLNPFTIRGAKNAIAPKYKDLAYGLDKKQNKAERHYLLQHAEHWAK